MRRAKERPFRLKHVAPATIVNNSPGAGPCIPRGLGIEVLRTWKNLPRAPAGLRAPRDGKRKRPRAWRGRSGDGAGPCGLFQYTLTTEVPRRRWYGRCKDAHALRLARAPLGVRPAPLLANLSLGLETGEHPAAQPRHDIGQKPSRDQWAERRPCVRRRRLVCSSPSLILSSC